jgi:hypothetical protein
MTTTTITLKATCGDCGHPWTEHYGHVFGGCAHRRPECFCVALRPVVSPAERRAALRAEVGTEPLVSHVDDKRNIVIGHHVTEGRDGDNLRGGIVVERWHTDDGEPGVTAIDFRYRGKDISVIVHRFMVTELRQEVLPNPDWAWCAYAIRSLYRLIGQRIRKSGSADPLSDSERRYLHWAEALDHAIHHPKEDYDEHARMAGPERL